MPKIIVKFITNLKIKEATAKVSKATNQGLKDVITDIAGDTIKGSPVLSGNNRRSIDFEVGPGGAVAKNKAGRPAAKKKAATKKK